MTTKLELEKEAQASNGGAISQEITNLETIDEVPLALGSKDIELHLHEKIKEQQEEENKRHEEIKKNVCKHLDEVLSDFEDSYSEEEMTERRAQSLQVENLNDHNVEEKFKILQHQYSIARNEAMMSQDKFDKISAQHKSLMSEMESKDKNMNILIDKISDLKSTNIDLSKELYKAKTAIHDLSQRITNMNSSNEIQEIRIIERQNKEMIIDKFNKEISQLKSDLEKSNDQNIRLKSSVNLLNDRLNFSIDESKVLQHNNKKFEELILALFDGKQLNELFIDSKVVLSDGNYDCLKKIEILLIEYRNLKTNNNNNRTSGFEFDSTNIIKSPKGKIFNSTQHPCQENIQIPENWSEYLKKKDEQDQEIKDLNKKIQMYEIELDDLREKNFEQTCHATIKKQENKSTLILCQTKESGIQTDSAILFTSSTNADLDNILKNFIGKSTNSLINTYNAIVGVLDSTKNKKQISISKSNNINNKIRNLLKSLKIAIIRRKRLFDLIKNKNYDDERNLLEKYVMKDDESSTIFFQQIIELVKEKLNYVQIKDKDRQINDFIEVLNKLKIQVIDFMDEQEFRIRQYLDRSSM